MYQIHLYTLTTCLFISLHTIHTSASRAIFHVLHFQPKRAFTYPLNSKSSQKFPQLSWSYPTMQKRIINILTWTLAHKASTNISNLPLPQILSHQDLSPCCLPNEKTHLMWYLRDPNQLICNENLFAHQKLLIKEYEITTMMKVKKFGSSWYSFHFQNLIVLRTLPYGMFFSKSTLIMNTCFVHEPSKFCLRNWRQCDWDGSSQ